METRPEDWFLKHRARAMAFNLDGFRGAVRDEGAGFIVATFLIVMDGLRALQARCIELNGVQVVLSDDGQTKA